MFCHLDNCDNNIFLNTSGETDCVLQYVHKILQHYEGKYNIIAENLYMICLLLFTFFFISAVKTKFIEQDIENTKLTKRIKKLEE